MAAVTAAASPSGRTQTVAPHFVVAIINDDIVLRCLLSAGSGVIQSETVTIIQPGTLPVGKPYAVRCILYSPNLVSDLYPQFAWDASLDIDGASFYVGSVRQRCDVIEKQLLAAPVTANDRPIRAHLTLTRVRLAAVRSKDSDAFAGKLVQLLQDPNFNPRSGSLPLPCIAAEMRKRYETEYNKVIIEEHLGGFKAFVEAHVERFAIFHYREREINNRNLSNVTSHDERIAIRKEVRDSHPLMLPPGHKNEQVIIDLIKEQLKDRDSHVHTLMRALSHHEEFRVGMSAAFSALMHLLQKHREKFRWSTDPQQVCTIGLVSNAPSAGGPAAAATDLNDNTVLRTGVGNGGAFDPFEDDDEMRGFLPLDDDDDQGEELPAHRPPHSHADGGDDDDPNGDG